MIKRMNRNHFGSDAGRRHAAEYRGATSLAVLGMSKSRVHMKCQIHLSHCEQWTVVELIQGKAGA